MRRYTPHGFGHYSTVVWELLIVAGAMLTMVGAFFNTLPPADERFDDYSARMRETTTRAGPRLWRIGVVLAAVGIIGTVAV